MRNLVFVLLAACTASPSLSAVDAEFLRAWETAQKARPASVASSSRIAPVGEPGTPLTIRGNVVDDRGVAVPNAIVFAWQTDANGRYDRPGTPAHSWRLRGWARSDARGAVTFQTIRPGAYPNGQEPAHVHFTVETDDDERYFTSDLQFADDPLLQKRSRNPNSASKVTERDGRQQVEVTLRLDPASRF